MSKKRKLSQESTLQTVEMTEKIEELMTYQAFFQKCLTRGLVRPFQEAEINSFFKSLGLEDKETSDKYADALSKY